MFFEHPEMFYAQDDKRED